MKALVKRNREPGLWLEDVPEPEIGIDDVLVKVDRTGICGTDLHIYKWDDWAQATIPVPMVVGHEFVGTIVETGSNVAGFEVGDIVSAEGHVVCGQCRHCLAGRRHFCKDTQGIGVNRPGAFAEFLSVPKTNVWKHPADIDRDIAAIFDPYGNAVHTALAFPVLGEDVLITGAGPIGLMAVAICRYAGARSVVVTDVNEYRLELARKMGATVAINVTNDRLVEVMPGLHIHEGFDVGLEMSGVPAAFNDMIGHMAHGGKIALLGIPPKELTIDWNKVVFNMLTLRGIYGREMYETWYKMKILLEGGLDISPVITHSFPATDFEEGFALMKEGNCGKVILNWS